MIRKLFICTVFVVIGVLVQANLNLAPTLAAKGGGGKAPKLGDFVTIVEGPINGMPGPHIIITGANLHIRSGEGVTDGANTGVGNLVVGYNEEPPSLNAGDRDGTHNLIVGPEHRYLSFGGFLAGISNITIGANASVSGGAQNTAGPYAFTSVSGGLTNTASGEYSSVSGGQGRTAPGPVDWVAGTLFQTQ